MVEVVIVMVVVVIEEVIMVVLGHGQSGWGGRCG